MSTALRDRLKGAYRAAVARCFSYELSASEVVLRPTPKGFSGQLSFTIFSWAKKVGKPLSEIGTSLGEALQESPWVSSYEVVHGFLNLQLEDRAWIEAVTAIEDKLPTQLPSQKILIEYSSPNTNKPLHLGHMRNNFLGHALSRIFEALGHKSYQVSLVNDRGIHICKSMAAYLREGGGEVPDDPTQGDHLVGKYYVRFEQIFQQEVAELQKAGKTKEDALTESPIMQEARRLLRSWEAGDPSVHKTWQQLNSWVYQGFESTYKRMGIRFDKTYYESKTYLLGKELIEEGLKRGIFYKKEGGAVAVNLSEEGLGEKILLRSDGTSVYVTQDIGTAELKYKEYPFDCSLYVVGDEQNHHFRVLFAILKQLERPYAARLSHISYGMVDLPSGKMKSREGTVVDADQLLDDLEKMAAQQTQRLGKLEDMPLAEQLELHKLLAVGAVKYFLLKVHPSKRMLFDSAASLDLHTSTAAFVQYTYARIAALLRRAQQEGIRPSKEAPPQQLSAEEQAVVAQLIDYPEEVAAAATAYDPSLVIQYVYELSRRYNRWYETHPIFKSSHLQPWRLWISARSHWRLRHGLSLLGIAAPERM